MSDNPFERGYVAPKPAEQEKPKPAPSREAPKASNDRPLLVEAGAYPDVDAEDYHRNPNLLPGPSLSSSGAKRLLNTSPYHFWFDSPLNPNRPGEPNKRHFNVGKAAHDIILLTDRWEDHYHVTPEGFSRAKTKAMEAEIAEADAAIEEGKTVLSHDDHRLVETLAAQIRGNKLAMATIAHGVTEETLVWKDVETGVWLRARPDFRPHSIVEGRDNRVVSDLKFVASTHATPDGFSKAIANFGYHQSAALYADGIKAIYGTRPTHWVHVVVEKEPPYSLSFYELPGEDIERGRLLNRRAINLFADCLEKDRWPGFADQPRQIGLPYWARNRIDDATDLEYATAAAA